MQTTNPRLWFVVAPGGVHFAGLCDDEAAAWQVALGWPDAAEIAERKAAGWYAAEATATWKRPAPDGAPVAPLGFGSEIADALRVMQWAKESPRRRAQDAFTAGPERQAAYWIEFAEASAAERNAPLLADLAVIVRRLCRSLERSEPERVRQAVEFLKRHGLDGRTLREELPEPDERVAQVSPAEPFVVTFPGGLQARPVRDSEGVAGVEILDASTGRRWSGYDDEPGGVSLVVAVVRSIISARFPR